MIAVVQLKLSVGIEMSKETYKKYKEQCGDDYKEIELWADVGTSVLPQGTQVRLVGNPTSDEEDEDPNYGWATIDYDSMYEDAEFFQEPDLEGAED